MYSGNATERLRGCIISQLLDAILILIAVVCGLYNITWRGLACVAYPYIGAMRRPELRDRRGGIYSHVFFVSINLKQLLTAELGVYEAP